MSDVNKGAVFHVDTKRQATNEARRLQRDEGGSGQKRWGGTGHHVEIRKSGAHDSPLLTASISLVSSESILHSAPNLNITAVSWRASGESVHHLRCLHLSHAWVAQHLHLQAP